MSFLVRDVLLSLNPYCVTIGTLGGSMTRMVLFLVAFLASALPLQAAPFTFTATLNGASESPANASPATGSAIVTFDDTLLTLRVEVTFAL